MPTKPTTEEIIEIYLTKLGIITLKEIKQKKLELRNEVEKKIKFLKSKKNDVV